MVLCLGNCVLIAFGVVLLCVLCGVVLFVGCWISGVGWWLIVLLLVFSFNEFEWFVKGCCL